MKKSLLAILLLSSGLMLTACNDSDDNDDVNNGGSAADVNNIQNPVVGTPTSYSSTDLSSVAADSVVMTYKMKGIKGAEVQATALVFIPKTVAPATGWPIVAWAHGTTGVADICAPSRNALNPSVQAMITQFLEQGYVVVAPDYEGLGEPNGQELHPFLNLKSEAYSITDAVVATRNWLGSKASNQWVTVGHSQGGQAALGAAQYAARANINYKGTVAVAPASNLGTVFSIGQQLAQTQPLEAQIGTYASLNTYAALIVAGMQGQPNATTYSQIFKSDSAAVAPQAENICAEDLGLAFGQNMLAYASTHNNALTGYGLTQDDFMSVPNIATFLNTTSQPLQVQVKTPITIYQGGADKTVPKVATDALNATAKAFGTQVIYITDPSWNHSSAYALNIDNIVMDVKTMFSSQ